MKAKNDFYNYLTKGRDYTVLNSIDTLYLVVADNGVRVWLDKTLFESEHLSNAKRIADEASALAERERIRDIVAEQVRNSCSPGGDIFKSMRGEMTVGIQDRVISKSVDSVIENARFNALINSEHNECVKVLEQLREVLRVPEGENIVTHAKVVRALADALIGLQNSTFC
ncbi:hypothetical protein SORKZAUGG_78 [Citrobacter phage vB_CfrD_SorkZaugg]|uniref:Uncharacterized protein n=1 Tax=Citrobacter phage vB_CfrD_SorkZaugg TaxID=2902664 RepID=A0AC61TQT1_9CAUD|nr:hypothetical protein SORKZAUGG_78 [Citrobacter phage vB_CfrD_SorkZaugg]